MKFPFGGGGKERGGGEQKQPEIRPGLGVQKPLEDPYAAIVSYYAGGQQTPDEIRPALEQKYKDTPEVVEGIVDRINAAKEQAQQRQG